MMMMKLPILPCAEQLELVLSTAKIARDADDVDFSGIFLLAFSRGLLT